MGISEKCQKFLIIGNKNAITFKEIFPLIKANKMWTGVTAFSGGMWFVADYTGKYEKVVDGVKLINVPAIWFANLDHGRRHQTLPLMTMADNLRFSKHKEIKGKAAYDRYDNFDAIEVPFTDAIPSDHGGMMGVPITFLDKYNPEQFEIVGCFEGGTHGEELGAVKAEELSSTGRALLWNGPIIDRKRVFKRIVIRHRTRSARGRKK